MQFPVPSIVAAAVSLAALAAAIPFPFPQTGDDTCVSLPPGYLSPSPFPPTASALTLFGLGSYAERRRHVQRPFQLYGGRGVHVHGGGPGVQRHGYRHDVVPLFDGDGDVLGFVNVRR